MKKKTIIISIIGVLLIAVIGIVLWIAKNGIDISTGICMQADNERCLLIVGQEPVAMHQRSGDGKLFDEFETGDKLFVVHDGIAETLPAKTGVYFCFKIGTGEEIPEEVIVLLKELGWISE